MKHVLGLTVTDWVDTVRTAARRWATPMYLLLLGLASVLLVLGVLQLETGSTGWNDFDHGGWWLTAWLMLWPASEAVVAVLHRLLSEGIAPRPLPRLALADGITPEQRALVVMPVLLTTPAAVAALAAQLEQHQIANPERHTQFALLTDWPDAAAEQDPADAPLLQAARHAVETLNQRHPARPGEALRFLLLHRRRRWSDGEQRWIGWERKRGKLEQLIGWLAQGGDSPFVDLQALSRTAPGIVSVLTLDGDTVMPPGRLRELTAVAAHPLNRPQVDPRTRRVTAGYAILQPRVVVPLPAPGSITPYHWLFSGQWGGRCLQRGQFRDLPGRVR